MPDCSSQIVLEALSDERVAVMKEATIITLVEIRNQFAAELMQFDFIEHARLSVIDQLLFCYVKNRGMNCLAYWRRMAL